MLIDCRQCTARSIACHDCVVTFLLDEAPSGLEAGVELSAAEIDAVAVLADQGVVPPLRLRLLPGGHHHPSVNHQISDNPDESLGGVALSR